MEVVFVDNGQIATIHLANINAPKSTGAIECFGREVAEYFVQSFQKTLLISIELTGEFENDEVAAYITLAVGTLLNEMLVLFGYARYNEGVRTLMRSEFRLRNNRARRVTSALGASVVK